MPRCKLVLVVSVNALMPRQRRWTTVYQVDPVCAIAVLHGVLHPKVHVTEIE